MGAVNIMKSSACRNLFGTDHIGTEKILQCESSRLDAEMKQKYGFDFFEGSPLENHTAPFNWIAVAMGEYIPESYRMPNIAMDLSAKDYITFMKNYNHSLTSDINKSTCMTTQNKGCQTYDPVTLPLSPSLNNRKRSAQKNITGKFEYL